MAMVRRVFRCIGARTFEQALKLANALSAERRTNIVGRLDRVRVISHEFGYGVRDDMDFLVSKYPHGLSGYAEG